MLFTELTPESSLRTLEAVSKRFSGMPNQSHLWNSAVPNQSHLWNTHTIQARNQVAALASPLRELTCQT